MAELPEVGEALGEGSLVTTTFEGCRLAGNRLNLDVYPDGCRQFLELFEKRREEVDQEEFLRPYCTGAPVDCTLGGHAQDEFGACQQGSLTTLPQDFGSLLCLTHLDLSFNSFSRLPSCVTDLASLRVLLVCHNSLVELPEDFGQLSKLTFFSAMKNQLRDLPRSIGELAALQRLDLSENALQSLPDEIGSLYNCMELDLSGNQLMGVPDSLANLRSLQQLRLHSNLLVTVPASLASLPNLSRLDLQNNWLRSIPPEIQHSPFVHLRGNPLGEPEIPLQSGNCVSGLTASQTAAPRLYIPHFSWFLVISRLVENKCSVPSEGTLLFSTVDPSIKVTFPPGVTEETRSVTLQVCVHELAEITDDPESKAGPLLCLSQNSTVDFLRPVKIQLPLPPGVTGLTLDRSKLHLLHGNLQAQAWDDITNQVVLEFTHLYARFEVTHFSWYWLWYTTKTYVGGIARKVYERLRLYQVNFIALQRKKDPEQVLLQCVPKHKVDPVLGKLHDRYQGPEPSDIVELFEGEQFFAAFEGGINIDADRPDCVDGRISFIFYSHLKNMKEIYVTAEVDRKGQAVRGQVSFYRGEVPDNVPEDATKKRKGPDSHWLATLPIKLPKLKSRSGEHSEPKNGFSFPPLNLGNAETGYLTQANLLGIAGRIGADWQTIGLNLGLPYQQIKRIGYNHREDLDSQILNMLFSWAQQNSEDQNCVEKLITAMKESGRQDIADEIETVIELGRQKYRASIRRVGLDQESSAEDSAIAMV
uniref:P53-induced death domain protein 1 n=1 Tax=Chrysemys picta bellii TaxID=8478 RepID=A0A8C3IJH5_CHRPI